MLESTQVVKEKAMTGKSKRGNRLQQTGENESPVADLAEGRP